MSKLVNVYVAHNGPHAQMLASVLRANGIEAQVIGLALLNVCGQVPMGFVTGPQVAVPEEDAARAREFILSREGNEPSAVGPDWQCPECTEVVDGGFEICWNCEHEAPQLSAAE